MPATQETSSPQILGIVLRCAHIFRDVAQCRLSRRNVSTKKRDDWAKNPIYGDEDSAVFHRPHQGAGSRRKGHRGASNTHYTQAIKSTRLLIRKTVFAFKCRPLSAMNNHTPRLPPIEPLSLACPFWQRLFCQSPVNMTALLSFLLGLSKIAEIPSERATNA